MEITVREKKSIGFNRVVIGLVELTATIIFNIDELSQLGGKPYK